MTELDDLEIGITRLKKTSNEQKKIIDELKRERSFLIKKNNEIEDSIKIIQNQIKPAKSDVNELKKELEELSALIHGLKAKESKFETMLTEQKSNLFLMRSRFEKDLDKLFAEIDDKMKQNKRIELTTFNELKSKVEKLKSVEDRLKDQDKDQKTVINRLVEDISKLQKTVTSLEAKRFDTELDDLSRRISSETKSLARQVTEGSEVVLGLRDKLQYFEPVVKELSEKLESQTKLLNRIMESKEFLLKRNEAFSADIRALKEKISAERERIGILEKEMDGEKKTTDQVRKDLESAFQQTLRSKAKELETNIISKSNILEEDLKSLNEKIAEEKQKIAVLEKEMESDKRITENIRKDLESSFQQTLRSKSKELEANITGKYRLMEEDLKSLKEKISEERERLGILENEKEIRKKEIDEVKKNLESTTISNYKDLEKELKYLTKELSLKKDKIAVLEQDLKNQEETQDSRFKQLDDSIDDIRLGEAKRGENFNNMVGRLQELKIKTEESLKSLNEKIKDISTIEKNLEIKFHKENEAIFKRIGSSYDKLDEKIDDSGNLITKLNESIKGLGKRLEDQVGFVNEFGKRLSSAEHDLGHQSKNQEVHAKNLDNVVKIIAEIEKRMAGPEKVISQLDQLTKRLGTLEDDSDRIGDLNKRILSSEKLISSLNTSVKGLESDFHKNMKTHADELEDVIKSLTKDIYEEKQRIALIEQNVKNQMSEHKLKNKDIEVMKKDLGDLDERISSSEKTISHVSNAVTDMRTRIMDDNSMTKKFEEQSRTIDKVTRAGERLTRLEEKLKSQERDQDLRFSELISVIKELELAEAKRIEEFTGFVGRFQNLRTKTEQNLETFNENLKKLATIKKEIKSEVGKENSLRLKELGIEFSGVNNRIKATEELVIQLNDMINQVRLGLEGLVVSTKTMEEKIRFQENSTQKLFADANKLMRELERSESKRARDHDRIMAKFDSIKIKTDEAIKSVRSETEELNKMRDEVGSTGAVVDDKINTFKDEINSRIQTNEEMYDSEMDAFKNKLDNVVKELVTIKEMQASFGAVQDTIEEAAVTEAQPETLKPEQPPIVTKPVRAETKRKTRRTTKPKTRKSTKPKPVPDETYKKPIKPWELPEE